MRIKCPHCNGKGFSEINSALNMTCGWCMGKGELDLEIVPTEPQTEAEIEKKWENTVWDTDVYLDDIDGKEPMTKEEWRKNCSAEEFAEALAKVVLDLIAWNNDPKPSEVRNILKAWLKQPHTIER